jgi:hypothetical protein
MADAAGPAHAVADDLDNSAFLDGALAYSREKRS